MTPPTRAEIDAWEQQRSEGAAYATVLARAQAFAEQLDVMAEASSKTFRAYNSQELTREHTAAYAMIFDALAKERTARTPEQQALAKFLRLSRLMMETQRRNAAIDGFVAGWLAARRPE